MKKLYIYISIFAVMAMCGACAGTAAEVTEEKDESIESIDSMAEAAAEKNEPDTVDAMSRFRCEAISDSLFAAIDGVSYHSYCPVKRTDLRHLRILHHDGHGKVAEGELICHRRIADDLLDIFKELYLAAYPIESVKLVDAYGGDDERSMQADNSSCFNCRRTTAGGKLSKHAYGMAIDINPFYNPYVRKGRKPHIAPANSEAYARRDIDAPYMIKPGDACHRAFTKRGFKWGGAWRGVTLDYQHFEK